MSQNTFSWLHLTDLHFGLTGQDCRWPNLRQPFLEDLFELHQRCGPWDAVFFTGDLVQKGVAEEFTALQTHVLDELWQTLEKLGSGDDQGTEVIVIARRKRATSANSTQAAQTIQAGEVAASQ